MQALHNPMNRMLKTLVFAAALVITHAAQGTLHDRGGGLLYDDVLDVTWLQDANYARSSGQHPTGKMSYAEASKWVSKLVYHDPARKVDITGWRLPKVEPISNNVSNHEFRLDGTTDEGYNITSPRSEFSYMYYVNLGLDGWWTKEWPAPEDLWRDEELDRGVERPERLGPGEKPGKPTATTAPRLARRIPRPRCGSSPRLRAINATACADPMRALSGLSTMATSPLA